MLFVSFTAGWNGISYMEAINGTDNIVRKLFAKPGQ